MATNIAQHTMAIARGVGRDITVPLVADTVRVRRAVFRPTVQAGKTDRVYQARSVGGTSRSGIYAALMSTRLARASGAIGTVMFSIPF